MDKPNAYCVCLILNRRSNLRKPRKCDRFENVEQKLSNHEQYLFQQQSERLQEKHASHMLIAFNIMKENFDPAFIRETVASLIRDITDSREYFLLKFLAFVNFYDISQAEVECSAFDDVMGIRFWEERLSDALNVLIVQDISNDSHAIIKISHHKISEEILKVMNRKKMSEFTVDLLQHRFLKGKFRCATLNLRRLLAGKVKQRNKDANGYKEQFAPLVLQIKKQESWEEAATVIKVYQLTDDPFVAQ